MGTIRRLGVGIVIFVVAGLVAFVLFASPEGDAARTVGAADPGLSSAGSPTTVPSEPPAAFTGLPGPAAPSRPAPAPAPEVAPPEPAPPAPPADVASPAPAAPPADVPIPHDPVPVVDRTGPSISGLRFAGCVFLAEVSDPAGVGVVTLTWSGVADPDIAGAWITEPGSSRMQPVSGVRYQGSRPRPYFGQVFTVTAVDRTLVGNRSQASITVNFGGYPC